MNLFNCKAVDRARRRFLIFLAGWFSPSFGAASAETAGGFVIPAAVRDVIGNVPVKVGRVRLEVPQLADNGNSVPLRVAVESAMTESDHVRGLLLIAEKNPRPMVARFYLGPRAGRAEISTRIRLAGTQRVIAIAQMADDSYWAGIAEVVVTLAACVDET